MSGLDYQFDIDAGIERWLVGHASELASAGVDPRSIRAEAQRLGSPLREAARAMITEWLARLE